MLGLEGGTGKRAITRWNLARCLPYEDLETTKDLGLDQYEVRSYLGWYRHLTLVLLAAAFLLSICVQNRYPAPPDDASPPASPVLASHLQFTASPPLIPLTSSEVRHLLAHLIWPAPTSAPLLCHWSCWRRTHQYWAGHYHRRRREKAS